METGKTYKVHHSRKGTFTMRITKDDGGWVEGVIVDGEAKYLTETNRVGGEAISIRKSLCSFKKID